MNNKTYDILKWIVIIVLPAFAVFVGVVGHELNWIYTDTFVTILNAFTAFLGVSLGFSNNSFKDEHEIITTKKCRILVDIDGKYTYACTACDFRPDRDRSLDNGEVGLDIDREKFIELLVNACKAD